MTLQRIWLAVSPSKSTVMLAAVPAGRGAEPEPAAAEQPASMEGRTEDFWIAISLEATR